MNARPERPDKGEPRRTRGAPDDPDSDVPESDPLPGLGPDFPVPPGEDIGQGGTPDVDGPPNVSPPPG